ncbi:MAG: endonuclease domain-containing protein [Pseudomonadota bacterium]
MTIFGHTTRNSHPGESRYRMHISNGRSSLVFPFSRLREKVPEGRMRVYGAAMTTRQIEPKRLDQARRLRRSQTPAEERLWSGLRGRRLQGHKFIRQHSIGPFTVDFLCREAALVVEVDGAAHSEDHDIDYDTRRTAYLGLKGYRVLRILNDAVFIASMM